MFCQLAFSGQAFERLIKYRIADLFRPLSDTVDHKGQKSWLDGMLVTAINFTPVANDRFVIVNHRANDSILPNPNGYGYQAGAVRMDLTTEFYFVLDQDVKTAGLRQPPFQTELVTGTALRVTIRAGVDANGVPTIQLELDTDALKGLPLPPGVIERIGGSVSATFPFDIGGIVKDIFPPGNDKVLNAGITRDDDNAIVMRFEFPGTAWQSDIAHAQDWQRFFSLDFHANLDGQEWCMDLDGSAVAAGLAVVMDPSFKNEKPIRFDAGWIDSGFIDGDTPRVVITKHARIENACAGNDVRFGAFANLDLSVPTENLLRAELSFDIDKDDGDIARCLGLGLINPFSVFITAVDNGQLGIGFAELAASFVFPTKAFIAMSAIGLLFVGVDKTVARKVIDDKLKDNPKITKLPDGGSAYDRALKPQSELTKDWLFLKRCVGRDGRLLLTGDLRVPDAVLPRLTASDLEGLSKWTLIDKCDPGKGQVSDGSLTLSLTPGYGADKARVQPVKVPTISLKWGVRPDGGDLIYDVLNDDLGIYKNQVPEYRQVYVPGIPGVVEATLKASTVRMKAFSPFGPRPYPLRLRFYTSGGVREYQFATPPVLQDFVETNHDAFIRINNCKHRGASLVFHRYLSLKWLGNPSPELGESAQQWEVHVRGLAPGRKATVWNQDSGAPPRESLCRSHRPRRCRARAAERPARRRVADRSRRRAIPQRGPDASRDVESSRAAHGAARRHSGSCGATDVAHAGAASGFRGSDRYALACRRRGVQHARRANGAGTALRSHATVALQCGAGGDRIGAGARRRRGASGTTRPARVARPASPVHDALTAPGTNGRLGRVLGAIGVRPRRIEGGPVRAGERRWPATHALSEGRGAATRIARVGRGGDEARGGRIARPRPCHPEFPERRGGGAAPRRPAWRKAPCRFIKDTDFTDSY